MVPEQEVWGKLIPLSGSGKLYELKTPQVTIGAREGLTITFNSPGIAAVHAVITRGTNHLTTELQVFTPNTIAVNDRILEQAGSTVKLLNGDMILFNKNQIGSTQQESYIFSLVFDALKRRHESALGEEEQNVVRPNTSQNGGQMALPAKRISQRSLCCEPR